MKDLHSFANLKYYRLSIILIILFMFSGVYVVFTRSSAISLQFYVHLILVMALAFSLWVYPRRESLMIKATITILSMIYFYALFIMYPETTSTFVLLCLSPGIAILFFDPRVFYFSLGLNVLGLSSIFCYVNFIDKGQSYSNLYNDLTGNVLNSLASQATVFLIFFIMNSRIKKMQVYYEQIQQAERLKTTGQLVAAVAHEIRNPITVVKGFLQLFNEDKAFVEKREHFRLMLDELNIAETVISDFLTIAKEKDTRDATQVINVKQSLYSVVDLIQSFALINNISIQIDIKEDSYINCSLIEFKQLMINLLKNAIEASPYGSTVSVQAKQNKLTVDISITDFGSGMTDEELKVIGTPFYSLKSKGTGLGLMICFNIIEKYNGAIRYNSEIGKGTMVTVSFPAKIEPDNG
ncbi:sensor histidine kinase [Bacillus marasmi]|uniref:sensor histidine kinase n=1 Tax=Bacillus marasmi TaxID=1926279 RepID=UPI00164DE941|nr:HAMP domain-containing sensor histidine kinase [Bacillus marasmi]